MPRESNYRQRETVHRQRISSKINQVNAKLAPGFTGPYKITQRIEANVYMLQGVNKGNRKTETSHVRDLKKYRQ